MTVQDIINKLDLHGFGDTPVPDKVDMINDYIWELTEAEPWPFLEKTITLTFDGSSGTPTNWPSDFRSVLSIHDTVAGNRLEPIDREQFYENYPLNLTDTGNPTLYYFTGYTINVWPIPSSSSTANNLVLYYIANQPELSQASLEADILIPKQFHSIIWNGTLAALYDLEDDPDQSIKFEQRADKKINRMREAVWRRQFDRPNFIEVRPEDADFYSS